MLPSVSNEGSAMIDPSSPEICEILGLSTFIGDDRKIM